MAETLLIISPAQIFPTHSGNSKRIHSVCSELMSEGCKLDFFYAGFERELHPGHHGFFNGRVLEHDVALRSPDRSLRISEILNGLKIRFQKAARFLMEGGQSSTYNKGLAEYRDARKLERLEAEISGKHYDAVIVNYAVYSHYFELFSQSCLKIIDTHDRLSDRYKLYLEQGEVPPNWHSLRPEDESKALKKADIVWAITHNEADYFRSLLTGEDVTVKTLRHIIPYEPVAVQRPQPAILFTGSQNQLNRDGIRWFLKEVWPEVNGRADGLKLIIAGTICDLLKDEPTPDGVELYGRFGSSREVYALTELCINPMRTGTGLKIKTMEALAAAKGMISTTNGCEGLEEFIGSGLICSDEPANWIESIGRWFDDPGFRKKAREGAQQKVEKMYQKNLQTLFSSLHE
ncbi:MAG: glycosyltransferase [Bacteroidetes bacterium]|nr:glycosyltransferase [Bacteroidota bacterium]